MISHSAILLVTHETNESKEMKAAIGLEGYEASICKPESAMEWLVERPLLLFVDISVIEAQAIEQLLSLAEQQRVITCFICNALSEIKAYSHRYGHAIDYIMRPFTMSEVCLKIQLIVSKIHKYQNILIHNDVVTEDYEAIFNQTVLGLYYMSSGKWHIERCNNKFVELFGYSRQELASFPAVDLVSDVYKETEIESVKDLLQGKKDYSHTVIKVVCKDGSSRWIDLNKSYVEKNQFHEGYVFGVFSDITERIITQEKLVDSKNHFDIISEHFIDWVWELDIQGCYVYSKGKIMTALGFTHLGYLPDEPPLPYPNWHMVNYV